MTQAPLADIPVHLITGFLGSGKSSLIRHLIDHKPAGERWAILVNEFGRVGIDQTFFAGRDDVAVQALPGGCLCCQLATLLQTSLVQLLRRQRPDRLIIEPSGLGHPAGLLDMLRGEAFVGVLDLREVITVLDPRRLDDRRALEHATFRDQLALADGIALTMTDLVIPERLDAARDWLAAQLTGAPWVEDAPYGRLPPGRVLEGAPHRAADAVARPSTHQVQAERPVPWLDLDARAPMPGAPVREQGASLGHVSLGWRWHAEEIFKRAALQRCLDGLPAGLRVKGVFHIVDGWIAFNRVAGNEPASASEWRRDSRLEVIGAPGSLPDADALEAELAACRV